MKKMKVGLSLLICLIFIACAGVQEKWNSLTPDQKARVIVNDLQGQLNNLFDQGKVYVATKPEHQVLWKTNIVPAFDQANKSIKTIIDLGKNKTLTPEYVYSIINPRIVEVVAYLVKIGAIKQ
jgi:hypothetical protein